MNDKSTVAAVLLALTAGPALAQEDNDRIGRNEGLYLGAGVGDFSAALDEIDELDDVDEVGIDFSDSENARKLFGGWRFNQYVALQGDFVDFGESSGAVATSVSPGTSDVQGVQTSVVGTLPIGPIELFGRFGVMFYEVDLNLTGGRFIDESGEDLVWAAGLGLDIGDRLNLRLEYEEIEIEELDEADALWLTAAWKF